MRKFTQKQIRYLWAVGYIKSSPNHQKFLQSQLSPVDRISRALSQIDRQKKLKKESNLKSSSILNARLSKVLDVVDEKLSPLIKSRKAANSVGDDDLSDELTDQIQGLKQRRDKVIGEIQSRLAKLSYLTLASTDPTSHEILDQLSKNQRFDKTPKLLKPDEFEKSLSEGTLIYRGVAGSFDQKLSANQIHDQFRSGKLFIGSGMFGNGTYFSQNESFAEGYSDGSKGSVMRAILPKSAKVIDYENLLDLYEKVLESHPHLSKVDESSLAVVLGYDAVERKRPDGNHLIILNRGALIVENP